MQARPVGNAVSGRARVAELDFPVCKIPCAVYGIVLEITPEEQV